MLFRSNLMLNMIILIFVGGAFGAMCREFIMLSVPRLTAGFSAAELATVERWLTHVQTMQED